MLAVTKKKTLTRQRGRAQCCAKRINLMLKWQVTVLYLNTDSHCMYHWVINALIGKLQLNSKATSEMLIQWRLETLIFLVNEYDLSINIALVKSHQNQADSLTRAPQSCFNSMREIDPSQPVCAFAVGDLRSWQRFTGIVGTLESGTHYICM